MSEFLSRLGGAALNDLKGTPLDKIVNHLMGGQQGASGLEALVEKLRSSGLKDQVESWISTGNNRPVAPQELEQALSPGEADRLASSAGMERPGVLALLSQVLPRLIDGMTPQGRLPTQGEMPEGGLGGMLRQILGHLGGERDAAPPPSETQAGTGAEEGLHRFGESPPTGMAGTEPGSSGSASPQGSGPKRDA
ncbi:MAG: hypothetical protein AVDCRST_MAG08-3364 [uncultured Acetobacteraceae bacterium]|uniref:DUF937 domain-containing protein n=1 Tax=uncultured Acetobacteraceae bacterium TaxID=169975 RepID=A0A6J4JCV8_9PROT|nr:MAG: hypothetical protein AVDCRST_MAG08-3364 [uncultured Acetobacteraceae bacterium]